MGNSGLKLYCGCPCSRSAQSKVSTDLAERTLAERVAAQEMELVRIIEEERLHASSRLPSLVASFFFPVLGILFVGLFAWTTANYPLLPLRLSDAEWGRQWLFTTMADYYTSVFCLLGIVLASESLGCGVLWCLAILLMGAPLACVYLVFRAGTHGTLGLVALQTASCASSRNLVLGTDTSATVGFTAGFYAVAGLSLLLRLLWTVGGYPLYPFQGASPDWVNEWLFTAVGGFCTAAVCLCGVIVSSEESIIHSGVWCLAVLLFGGPAACAYMSYRAVCCHSIMLQEAIADLPCAMSDALSIQPKDRSRPRQAYSRPAAVLDQMAEVQVQHPYIGPIV